MRAAQTPAPRGRKRAPDGDWQARQDEVPAEILANEPAENGKQRKKNVRFTAAENAVIERECHGKGRRDWTQILKENAAVFALHNRDASALKDRWSNITKKEDQH